MMDRPQHEKILQNAPLFAKIVDIKFQPAVVELKFSDGEAALKLCIQLNSPYDSKPINNTVYIRFNLFNEIFSDDATTLRKSDSEIVEYQNAINDFLEGKNQAILPISELTLFDQLRVLLIREDRLLDKAVKNPNPHYLQFFITHFSPTALACAMLPRSSNHISPWYLAATHQNSDSFMALHNNVKCHDTPSHQTMNLVHYAAQYQSLKIFISIFHPMPWSALRECVQVKNAAGHYLFETILLKQSESIAMNYFNNINLQSINGIRLWAYMLSTNCNWLSTIQHVENNYYKSHFPHYMPSIFYQYVIDIIKARGKVYAELYEKLSNIRFTSKADNDAIIEDKSWLRENRTRLIKPDEEFIPAKDYIEPLPDEKAESFIQTSKQQVSYFQPDFMSIVRKEGFDSPKDFKKAYLYFRKIRNEIALNEMDTLITLGGVFSGIALSQEKYQAFLNDKREHRFHAAITKYTLEEIGWLINFLPEKQLEIEIAKLDPHHSSGLKIAAKRLEKTTFKMLCQKVSNDSLRQACAITNMQGENAFHDAAVHQPFNNLLLMLDAFKKQPHDLRELLQKKNKSQTAPVHLMAYHVKGLENLFLDNYFVVYGDILDGNNTSAFSIAIAKQPESTVLKLIDGIRYLFMSVNNYSIILFEQAFLHQTTTVVIKFINTLEMHKIRNPHRNTLQSQLDIALNSLPKNIGVRSAFLFLLLTQDELSSFVYHQLFVLAPSLLTELAISHYYGRTLPNQLKKFLRNENNEGLSWTPYSWQNPFLSLLFSSLHSTLPEMKQDDVTFVMTSKKNRLRIDDPQFLSILYREGLRNHDEYFKLRKLGGKIPGLDSALKRLIFSNSLLSGSYYTWAEETSSKISYIDIRTQLDQGNLLLQWMPQDTWPTFMRRLNRQEDEALPEVKADTQQYLHMEDQIVPYQKPVDEKSHPAQNVRVISLINGVNTPIFNIDEKNSLQVGILYNRNQCHIKALFSKNITITPEEWIGTREQVEDYVKRIKPYHHTNYESLKSIANSFKVNLTFANLCAEAATAICIGPDNTLESRAYACTMAAQFYSTFQRELPIVILHPYCGIGLFLPEQLYADDILKVHGAEGEINAFLECENSARLHALRKDINEQKQWGSNQTADSKPAAAKAIIKLITDTEKLAFPFWSKTAKAVKQQLKTAAQTQGEAGQFFETTCKKYFG